MEEGHILDIRRRAIEDYETNLTPDHSLKNRVMRKKKTIVLDSDGDYVARNARRLNGHSVVIRGAAVGRTGAGSVCFADWCRDRTRW